jgi:ABC-type transport system substrate-binding protein
MKQRRGEDVAFRKRRSHYTRWMLAAVAASLAVVGLSACGGGEGGATGTAATGSGNVEDVKIVLNAPMERLDPNLVTSIQDIFVWNLIGGTLTKYGAGEDAGGPELAKSFVESPDGRSWTATLRPGLKFSDGSPLTAQDVQATFERILDDKAAFQRGYIPSVTKVKAMGKDKVVFSVNSPTPTLPTLLSQPQFAILPEKGIRAGKSFFTKPISAGRYVLDSFSPSSTRLSLNEDFHGEKPSVKEIQLSVTADDGARLAEVKRGDANFAWQLPAQLIPQITGSAHVEVVKEPGSIEMILNNEHAPLNDARVRQAISLAVNREAINESVWAGESTANAGYWPSLFPYYEPEQSVEPDIEKAKELLKGTECEAGCAIEMMTFSNLPWTQSTALIAQQNLQEIGIELELDPADEATAAERGQNGDFDIDLGPLTGLVVLPESLTPINLQPSGPYHGGLARYESPQMDALVEELLSAPLNQRPAIAKKIGALYAQDRPFVNLVDFGYVNASNLPESVLKQELFGFVVK